MPVTNYDTVDRHMIGYHESGVQKDFLTDALGSVTAEVDQTGNTKTFEGRYKPYGGDLLSTGTSGKFGWVGTLGYRSTGLKAATQYVRARHYNNVSGNWTTMDELWPSESAFGYVSGNVSVGTDPSGKQIVIKCLIDTCANAADVCKYAETHIDPTRTKSNRCYGKSADCGDFGGVVCCNGKRTACSWIKNAPASMVLPSGKEGQKLKAAVENCIKEHEREHIRKGSECPPKGFGRAHGGNECDGHKVGINCLGKVYDACKSKACQDYVWQILCGSCHAYNVIYSCPAPAPDPCLKLMCPL